MMEIILLIAGGIVFILSFFIPEGKGRNDGTGGLAEQEVKNLVSQELEAVRNHVDDVVEEAVTYSMERTERALERLSNEKIMAVNEYSDTVLKEIHKNHEEAMFLYDMLNNKHTGLKETIAELNRAVKEAQEVRSAVSGAGAFALSAAENNVGPETEGAYPVTASHTKKESTEEPEADILAENEDEEVNNNEQILTLYQAGRSAVEIARELGLGVGEVKLVLDLYRKNQ